MGHLAEKNYNKIVSQAKERRDEILEKAEQDGKKMAQPILDDANKEAEEIKAVPDDKFEEIVNRIVERIVN